MTNYTPNAIEAALDKASQSALEVSRHVIDALWDYRKEVEAMRQETALLRTQNAAKNRPFWTCLY